MKRKECDVEDCRYPRFAKGYCSYHQYLRTDKKKPKKWIAPVSEKQAERLAEYRVVRDEYLRDHPVCEFPDCKSEDVTLHHSKGRCGNLLTDMKWFKALCDKHHREVEESPLKSKEMGLSFNRLDNPCET